MNTFHARDRVRVVATPYWTDTDGGYRSNHVVHCNDVLIVQEDPDEFGNCLLKFPEVGLHTRVHATCLELFHARGRDTSEALAEVRTVLSRAETAVITLFGRVAAGTSASYMPPAQDPDAERIIDDLQSVIEILDRWRRTGRSK